MPYIIIIDSKNEFTFSQRAMAERQNSSFNDTRSGKFYISSDKKEWIEVGSFIMEQKMDVQTFSLTPIKGRYIKIIIVDS